MSEKPPIELKDIAQESEPKSETGLEIVETPASKQFVEHANEIHEAIEHDKKITYGQVADLRKDLEQFKFDVCGEQMTIAEIKQIPDFQHNYEIWKKIMSGELISRWSQNEEDLTYLLPKVAQVLVEEYNKKNEETFKIHDYGVEDLMDLKLSNIKRITPDTIKNFKDFKANIFLDGLTEISDESMLELSKSSSYLISLSSLTSLSDKQAEYLSQFNGGRLYLNSIKSLSDYAANKFAHSKVTYVLLRGVETISDSALLQLEGTKVVLSDTQKERLKSLKAKQNASRS
ncbi:MAG: hypothetical protein WC663_01470 [Patescibacteria group bacterium]|jgi:hypothetical protein